LFPPLQRGGVHFAVALLRDFVLDVAVDRFRERAAFPFGASEVPALDHRTLDHRGPVTRFPLVVERLRALRVSRASDDCLERYRSVLPSSLSDRGHTPPRTWSHHLPRDF